MAICTAEGAYVRAHRAPEREDATRPEAREKSTTYSEEIAFRWTTALGSGVGREARSPQNLGKLGLFGISLSRIARRPRARRRLFPDGATGRHGSRPKTDSRQRCVHGRWGQSVQTRCFEALP